jgi:hypothetical protein
MAAIVLPPRSAIMKIILRKILPAVFTLSFSDSDIIVYSNIENLVLWSRSEKIGSAIDQICSWVSGVSVQVSAIMSVISEALTIK